MHKKHFVKILVLLFITAILYFFYVNNLVDHIYKHLLAEGVSELLKHLLIEVIEHVRF